MAKKALYKVIGYAEKMNESDVEVLVKADGTEAAITEAGKKEPALKKFKDVRVYTKASQWTRVQ